MATVNNTIFRWKSEKDMELHLFVLLERKNKFLAGQILPRQRGAVMAFIPDLIKILFPFHFL